MAKLYKVELYLTDMNDIYEDGGLEDILSDIDRSLHLDVLLTYGDVEEVEFEWDDNLDINKTNCSINEYRKYFKSNK